MSLEFIFSVGEYCQKIDRKCQALQAENGDSPEPGPWRHATECLAKRQT